MGTHSFLYSLQAAEENKNNQFVSKFRESNIVRNRIS